VTTQGTALLFRDDAYLRATPATVIEVNARGGVVLDRTVFYATSGGQPGDSGRLVRDGAPALSIATAIHADDKAGIVHVPGENQDLPAVGENVAAEIDWTRRNKLMRMHTALHLLTVVFPFPITGAAVGEDKGRIDFDMPEVPGDRDALEAALNDMVAADYPVVAEWISEDALAAQPDLVKSLRVSPPRGQGLVRLIRIGTADNTVDLQPCGGTHVASTAEIGKLALGKIEKKGRENRRVSVLFA